MSYVAGRFLSRAILTLILGCVSTGFLVAQQDDQLLKDVKARQEIEAQRVEQEIRKADRNATAIGRSDPDAAVRILRGAIALLEADTAIPVTRRASLKRMLELGLRAFEGKMADRRAGAADAYAARMAQADARDREQERQRKMQADINQTMQAIEALRRTGQTAAAARLSDDLSRRYPGNTVVGAGRTIAQGNDLLADSRFYRREKARNEEKVNQSILESAGNITEDVSFPKDWVEKSKRRSKAMQMTATERKILRALNAPVSVEFGNETFGNVIQYMEKLIGEPIIVHREAMAELGVTYDSAINLRTTTKVATRTVLKKVLAELGLTYVIKDQAIQITSVGRARELMTTRVYYVGDLVQATSFQFGLVYNQLQMVQNVNRIMTLIQQTIDPGSWQMNNGPGQIAFDPISQSFVVRQSAEVHMMLGIGLR